MMPKIYCILLLATLFHCKEPISIPEAFKDDIRGTRHVDFHFDPNNLPKIGVTMENDLDQMYPEGPSGRTTFIYPRRITINRKTFDYDRKLDYMYQKVEDLSKPPEIIQYRSVENLLLTIFLKKKVVVFYLINHKVTDENDEWIPGKYNQRDITDEDWISTDYKESSLDGCLYWLQWPREARYQYIGNSFDGYTEEDCLKENGIK
ncbi:hypothetical protein [Leptospira bandrabouensis]|uniref:hypothetical protein n=1 Tax=Leptospira bandrabouensis TaxID=2484903 RepID=UPI001EE7A003|nr:hypothetical protein [Leptospira bandrabouensis]MCG6146550.1 hypothetical protein [Leptospira bandrabouensis]MCG6161923.1 hypothetical protein [Leptospira bandrabouensis]MCG6166112.1 hypothetical protein [Leptospira bandrabouensis]